MDEMIFLLSRFQTCARVGPPVSMANDGTRQAASLHHLALVQPELEKSNVNKAGRTG